MVIYRSVGNTELALNGALGRVCVCVCVVWGQDTSISIQKSKVGRMEENSSLNQDSYWKKIKANMKIANAIRGNRKEKRNKYLYKSSVKEKRRAGKNNRTDWRRSKRTTCTTVYK